MELSDEQSAFDRKRGRPLGRGRVPLSAEERRARNAQYERERRIETAEAIASLAAALGCLPNASNAEIIATAIQKLRKMQENEDPSDDVALMKQRNAKLMAQIDEVEERLQSDKSAEAQPKRQIKTGGIKKQYKSSKDKKNTKSVLRLANRSAQIGFAIVGNHFSDEDEQVPKTEDAAEDRVDSLAFAAITDCPMDWGIDNCIADYLL
ncbi:uncharacterized protein LOC110997498 isoform X1 [Pieris rapae]|uniref:uncharacterized protein LOC110997498 isoform X1 n=1 Tax=Pieris rapae TaxID=64459 RepID=UPI001E27EDA7|nr:uncharacterized protein LOC110997498 isoform X1 [Pieris rapae]